MQNSAVFVPHFHWDREWYEPFQVFRHRLVEALDTVLLTAEADPSFRFAVDGQTAAIRDYLEMRPQNRGRVEAASGLSLLEVTLLLLVAGLCVGCANAWHWITKEQSVIHRDQEDNDG